LIATDMDGTLTRTGKFSADLLQALDQLQQAGIPVVIVTGRSAGWVGGLVHYLPVAGAIAENGGVYIDTNGRSEILTPDWDGQTHRPQLAQLFARLQQRWPQIQPSPDNPFRLTDWTFAVTDVTPPDLPVLQQVCQDWGWDLTYSTVQVHLFKPGQSKAIALQQVLKTHFPGIDPEAVLTVGDSPNDESLFDPQRFPHSLGVANISHYWHKLSHHPTWVSQAAELDGFLEMVRALIAKP
jgi:hydroxymethylpyrimidine pyrophosphatase-like HAD family hydrolase